MRDIEFERGSTIWEDMRPLFTIEENDFGIDEKSSGIDYRGFIIEEKGINIEEGVFSTD